MAVDTRAPTSAVSSLIASCSPQNGFVDHFQNLALQVLHDLQHQHDWTSLHIHTHSPITNLPLARPLISGLPPHRIYVHPDDQVEELKRGLKDGEGVVEREWVLPTHLKEKWSLKRFAAVFDVVEEEPPKDGEKQSEDDTLATKTDDGDSEAMISPMKRRGGKRVLLATVGDDSTVVYYIIHDGIVKPRQN